MDTVDKIIKIYIDYGNKDYIGENGVTQIQHALQAANYAKSSQHSDKFTHYCVIAAAFLHDIGHLIGIDKNLPTMNDKDGSSLGIQFHEKVASEYLLSCGFPSLVCDLVESHVDCKRYLCTIDSDRKEKLSTASRKTLELQGGLMSKEETKIFESSPNFELKKFIRLCDDYGKIENFPPNNQIEKEIEDIKSVLLFILTL